MELVEVGGKGGWPELRLSMTKSAEGGVGWQEIGKSSCLSAPSSPTSDRSLSFGSDYYEFACQTEEEAEAEGVAAAELAGGGEAEEVVGSRSQERGMGGVGSLSFRTCSSAPSSPLSFRSVSFNWGEFLPMSEQEEIPSHRWVPALESRDTGDSHVPPVTSPPQNEEKPNSRRWLLPSFLRPRFSPAAESDGVGRSWRTGKDHLLRYQDLGRHTFGDFSVAVVQANRAMEDQCQIEFGSFGAFVGIYDGHGGPEPARYICDHLYRNFREISSGPLGVSSEAIEGAFLWTDEGFSAMVAEQWESNPRIAAAGSCCLVGVICHGTLYVANAGDSRVVLGTKVGDTGKIAATQLSIEHNVCMEKVRAEMREQHPHDPQIVILKHGVWSIKGIIQVSRSIGDVFMKHAEYNREPLPARFRVSEPLNMPILSAKPAIVSHSLHRNDSFLVFASDGLWENLSNEEAVKIVHDHPHAGSARRLVEVAVREAARRRDLKYSDIQRIDRGIRRHFHDDISVVVLFLNHDLVGGGPGPVPSLSVSSRVLGTDHT